MAVVSKNVYINVLDDIVNKYNNTVHRTRKMKPTVVTSDSYAEYNEDSNKKYHKFNVRDLVKISKYKIIFAKENKQNCHKKFLLLAKLKVQIRGLYVTSDLNGESITGSFYEKELKTTSQEKATMEKIIKKRVINCMTNGKETIIHLIVGLIKNTFLKIIQYFPKPFRSFRENINVKVDLLNYATRTDLKIFRTLILHVFHQKQI